MAEEEPLARLPAAFARELARAGTRAEAAATIERWRAALPIRDEPEARPAAAPTRVGIWRPERIDGRTWFVRDAPAAEGRSWADVDRIGPKRGLRVVLAGESCARGWPLDPFFTCAAALGARLRGPAGGAVEVVDLARLGLTAPALVELLRAAKALEPDACVVFAGNNWTVHAAPAAFPELAGAARQGWRAVADRCREVVRARIAAWTAGLLDALGGVPAVVVIPAENVRDYPAAATLYNPLLPSDRQVVRDRLLARVTRLQAEGRVAESEPLAARLVALEDGCSIAGLQALGRAALARGAIEEAARLFEEARELLVCFPVAGMSSYRTRNEALRDGCAAAGVPVVDVPRLLAALGGGVPPGREWFYDDCHMTARGIAAAMAEAARAVLPLLGLPPGGADRPDEPIDPRAEAQGACVAAIVNGHDERLVRAYLAAALSTSPELREVLRQYLELRLGRIPRAFSTAFHRLRELQGRFPALRYLDTHLDDHVRPLYHRDARHTRIFAEAIAAGDRGAPSRAEALLRLRYAGDLDEVDVLRHASPDELETFGHVPPRAPRAYVRCLRQCVNFHLLAPGSPRRWRFALTTRAPHRGSVGKPASLVVDGEPALTWVLSEDWTTVGGVHESLEPGPDVHVLTILWPDPGEDRDARLRHVARALAESESWVEFMAEVYSVWGEIQTFTAHAPAAEPDLALPVPAAGSYRAG